MNYSLGYIPDLPDKRDFSYSNVFSEVTTPSTVIWSNKATPIKQQGSRGACVAFAEASVVEFQEMRQRGFKKDIDLSEEWVYRHIALKGGGSYIREAKKLTNKIGIPEERHLPYNRKERDRNAPYKIDNAWYRRHRRAKGAARKHMSRGYAVLDSFDDIQQSLLVNGPFTVGTRWFSEWNNPRHTYKGYPLIRPARRAVSLGGHAVSIWDGYFDDDVFIFKNSWGRGWGRNGWAAITFDALMSGDYRAWASYDTSSPLIK